MLDIDLTTLRLFLHLLAATIWVGGQITLAALVPVLRHRFPEAPRAAARQFDRVAWPAFAVLVATGVWNVLAVGEAAGDDTYRTTLVVKLVVVALSGLTAFLHARAGSRRMLAVWGALTGLTALLALLLGVVLRG